MGSSTLPLFSSFFTVSALLPTLAIAASISGFDFLRRLHQYRAIPLLETSTQFRAPFTDEVVSMTGDPCEPLTSVELSFCSPKLTKERGGPDWVVGHERKQKRTRQMTGELVMDWDRIEGNWKQMKGRVKEKWGNLTDDDLDRVAGQREQLEGLIQQRYGIAKDQVRKDIDTWLKSV